MAPGLREDERAPEGAQTRHPHHRDFACPILVIKAFVPGYHHVTLTPGATALAVAGCLHALGPLGPFGHKANLAPRPLMGGLRMSLSCAYRYLRHRPANRLDHVTLTPGATALAAATDTLWVPSGTKAKLAPGPLMGELRMSMSWKRR